MFMELYREEKREEGDRGGQEDKGGIKRRETDPASNQFPKCSPREGNGNPLQYSCLGNPTDREAWRATVHGVAKESNTTKQLNKNNARFRETISVEYLKAMTWGGASKFKGQETIV